MYCIVLYDIALHCIVLYRNVLYCITSIVLCCIVLSVLYLSKSPSLKAWTVYPITKYCKVPPLGLTYTEKIVFIGREMLKNPIEQLNMHATKNVCSRRPDQQNKYLHLAHSSMIHCTHPTLHTCRTVLKSDLLLDPGHLSKLNSWTNGDRRYVPLDLRKSA